MTNRDVVEIYGPDGLLTSVASSIIPPVGSYINIEKKTWQITRVTFAVDYNDDRILKQMRCNIDVNVPL